MNDKTYSGLKRDNDLLSTANALLEKMCSAQRAEVETMTVHLEQLADALVMARFHLDGHEIVAGRHEIDGMETAVSLARKIIAAKG